ncbi:protein NLP7 isoform X2 [Lolium perenne]|uniref:protein NLP7 isoform X2 n=1 Tax=Lolium perenne TaxID=4522 RepID=UPI0021F5E381|nr:protein NLP5-like isoform X2 [Lolium perenne]
MDNVSVAPRLLSLQLLKEITNNFSKDRIVGVGSYGKVYKGEHTNGELIAVKVLHPIPGLDDEQFEKEYHNLASLEHKNIVRLVGYCHETQREFLPHNGKVVLAELTQRALCFEFMQNGSLASFLNDESNGHDWCTRYAIIKGICQGLKYLHEELDTPMSHLDLKPANVLLDEQMVPKITDFGLSRLFTGESSQITKSAIGTHGYVPPEYIDAAIISIKFDIYSLGVVIIKILAGPTGYFRSAEMSSQEFIELVHANWKNKLEKTSAYMLDQHSIPVKKCTEIALSCMNADRHKRPSIGVIINMLNEMETAFIDVQGSEGGFTCMEDGRGAQPTIYMARTTSSEGAAVDMDLLEQLLSDDNGCLEGATNASCSSNYFASPSTFLSDATTTTTMPPTSANNTFWVQSCSTFMQRLDQALAYIFKTLIDADVLSQFWLPVKGNDGQLVLSTTGMPFFLDKSSESLRRFRDLSTRYTFSTVVSSESSPVPVGLPGRVFMGKLPEWSPDVRYFSRYEYPQVNHAQHLNLHGAMWLPLFEEGNNTCLGVMEVIMTRQKLNFTSEMNNIFSALQLNNEILDVLREACTTHRLPLAQTWVTCAQQGKHGSRNSDENYRYCISTIDAACYVNDPKMQKFHDACSDHHLLRGQGVAGKAFTTNQPCFLQDIGSSTKMEYPLSHHARIFNLKGAVAIRLRCTRTGTADFVLEFFLPTDCEALEEQKAVLDSLSGTLRSASQTLRVVTDKEMEDEAMLEMSELKLFGSQGKNKVEELSFGDKAAEHREEASWTSLAGYSQRESDLAEQSIHGRQSSSLAGIQTSAQGSKGKRRRKTEKTVSLQVPQQYLLGRRRLGTPPWREKK